MTIVMSDVFFADRISAARFFIAHGMDRCDRYFQLAVIRFFRRDLLQIQSRKAQDLYHDVIAFPGPFEQLIGKSCNHRKEQKSGDDPKPQGRPSQQKMQCKRDDKHEHQKSWSRTAGVV